MSDLDILFISNGHGEDAIAARIARDLAGLALAGIPLVGSGRAYREADIPVLGPARDLPSGGWALRAPGHFLADWRHGWLEGLHGALRAARVVRPRLVVGVGDLLPAGFAAVAGLPPIVLVACNKTDYYAAWGESYVAIEVAALRCWDTDVLPRDEPTAARLARLGLRVSFQGNVMPDLVGPLPPAGPGIALVPGSRADARSNLPIMLAAVRLLGQEAGPVKVALAPGFEDLAGNALTAGVMPTDLAAALAPAGVAIATAGTAAEVAAAHGRPIVAFAGPGPQYTPSFAARQQQLLGDALLLCDRAPEAVAAAIRRVRGDAGLRAKAVSAGRDRIGAPGAAARMAGFLADRLASPR